MGCTMVRGLWCKVASIVLFMVGKILEKWFLSLSKGKMSLGGVTAGHGKIFIGFSKMGICLSRVAEKSI